MKIQLDFVTIQDSCEKKCVPWSESKQKAWLPRLSNFWNHEITGRKAPVPVLPLGHHAWICSQAGGHHLCRFTLATSPVPAQLVPHVGQVRLDVLAHRARQEQLSKATSQLAR